MRTHHRMTDLNTIPSGETVPALQYCHGNDTADFGDLAKAEREESNIEEVAEPWYSYDEEAKHIFYPVRLGEVLNERYLVEHKVGFGGFSTVWMAYDLQDKRDVALKVMCLGDWAETELQMQDKIIQDVLDTSHLVTYLATFLVPRAGGEGHHRVLVFPLIGPSLCWQVLKKRSIATRMSAARQLLETLKDLHEAGIVHRGEFSSICLVNHTLINVQQI